MECISINSGYVCLSKTSFFCPYCKKEYNDYDEVYYNKCNNNLRGYALVKCRCGKRFYVSYNYKNEITVIKKR